jgi:hypothetical protein
MDRTMAAHVGRETTLDDGAGRRWRLSRLERRHWREFFAWADKVLPDPLDVAERQVERLARRALAVQQDQALDEPTRAALLAANDRQQRQITAQALDQSTSHLSLDSPQVRSLLGSVEGSTELLRLLLQEHQPGASADDAYALLNAVGLGKVHEVFDAAAGAVPAKNA